MNLLIVADTGPLVILSKLNLLHLLVCLYPEVLIPETVLQEATALAYREDARRIMGFVSQHVRVVPDLVKDDVDYLDYGLDAGETQAISLAKQAGCVVLLDERRGRAAAKQEHIDVLGTVGLLLKAKQAKLIPEISNLLDKMLEYDYRLAPSLVQRAKSIAGELAGQPPESG